MTSPRDETRDDDLPPGDPLAETPRSVGGFRERGGAEMLRHVLAEEGIPAVVERDHHQGGWTVLVADAAIEDARKALENRAALASLIDWDNFEAGDLDPADARLLAGAARRRRVARIGLLVGTTLVLLMVLLGLVAMIASLIPSTTETTEPSTSAAAPGSFPTEMSDAT